MTLDVCFRELHLVGISGLDVDKRKITRVFAGEFRAFRYRAQEFGCAFRKCDESGDVDFVAQGYKEFERVLSQILRKIGESANQEKQLDG